MAYAHMAAVYDRLMADTPYDQWLDWVERMWAKGEKPQHVIDLGCGTGTIAIPLAKRGYRVTGVDLSAEMLAIAYDKMRQAQADVSWVEQDMRELELPVADAVISLCDSLSYLTEEADVQETFQRVFAHLAPGGSFLFDVHSPYKMLHIFGDETFTHVEDEVSYIWQCFCDPLRLEVEHQLTFFLLQPNGLYERMEEEHWQRAYQPIQLMRWLTEAGFTDIVITADYTDLPPQESSERLFFSARKPKDLT
ncbi:methyltransferase [Brevibacillus reuszeri]|uniref:Methylase n=1 Tax=Brevibacillus reuszeri TaxID=54915 RepID=A0A0K9YZE2_9BACL|nr:class I SAM-dependent methyltransferase [Brevibacillus reuszeri]KNB74026.1 methylase [Brevibacillus reuszeri]MED1859800.1 class I SAM-dependent methyltransferase [Brevibacillus reuszeri]GED72406.1 methyltransferase [Brevibacillus reuszeri]